MSLCESKQKKIADREKRRRELGEISQLRGSSGRPAVLLTPLCFANEPPDSRSTVLVEWRCSFNHVLLWKKTVSSDVPSLLPTTSSSLESVCHRF